MNLIGKKVTHTKYGVGKIVSIDENKMEVDFKDAIKPFIYPDSFEKHFKIDDKRAKEYIHARLEEINREKRAVKVQREKEEQLRTYVRKAKIKVNSQAVFAMDENKVDDVLDAWSIFTGNYRSGKTKGEPRIPRNLNMNSACLLTTKSKESAEKERIIKGIFMVKEDFIGANCETGIISAHKNYRIVWEQDQEDLLFWNYFPKESRLGKWGNTEMKYLPNVIIKKILEDMIKLTSEEEHQKNILDFYYYYCQMNHI